MVIKGQFYLIQALENWGGKFCWLVGLGFGLVCFFDLVLVFLFGYFGYVLFCFFFSVIMLLNL